MQVVQKAKKLAAAKQKRRVQKLAKMHLAGVEPAFTRLKVVCHTFRRKVPRRPPISSAVCA